MKTTDAAWCAGIIDGEGCLQIVEHPPRIDMDVSPRHYAIVSVTNTDKRIVERLKTIADGTVTGPVGRGRPGQWKPAYRWTCKLRKAENFLKEILPFLVSKRDQARIILHLRSLTFNGSKPGNCGVKRLSAQELSVRDMLRDAIQALNHRGGSIVPEHRTKALKKVLKLLNFISSQTRP